MSERKEAAAKEKKLKARQMIAVAFILLAVAAAVVVAMSYRSARSALTDAERQVKLLEDTVAALGDKNSEKEEVIRSLQSQLEEILNFQEPDPVITRGRIDEALTAASELVTQRYIYTNAARREGNRTWLWGWTMPLSDTSLLVTYDGEIKAGIDFSEITVDVNETLRTITVALPPSKVLNNDIPQESIQVLEVKNSLFNEITFDDYNDFIAAEKPVMEEKAISMGLLADADREARTVIRDFLNAIPGMNTYTLNIVTK